MVYRVGSLVQGISCLHLLRIGIICGLPSLHSILNNSGNLNCGHRAFPEMMQKIDLVVIIIAMIKHHDKRKDLLGTVHHKRSQNRNLNRAGT